MAEILPSRFLFRPPGTFRRPSVSVVMFFKIYFLIRHRISELPRPIATKLDHYLLRSDNPGPKIWGALS